MGLRFRKSIKAGPIRVNLSKSGIGYSVGGKGFRYTKKAGGGYRATTSIPGTGISYVQDSAGPKKRSAQTHPSGIARNSQGGNNMKKPKNSMAELLLCLFLGWAGAHKFYMGKKGTGILYLLTFGLFIIGWWGDLISLCMKNFGKNKGQELPRKKKVLSYAAGFLCVMLVGGCSSESEPAPDPTTPTMAIVATTEAVEETTIPTTEVVTEVTTEPTSESTEAPAAEPTTEPTTEPTVMPLDAEPEGRDYVLNTNTKKFHYPSCSSADDIKSKNRKDVVATRESLIAQRYEPCGRCDP